MGHTKIPIRRTLFYDTIYDKDKMKELEGYMQKIFKVVGKEQYMNSELLVLKEANSGLLKRLQLNLCK